MLCFALFLHSRDMQDIAHGESRFYCTEVLSSSLSGTNSLNVSSLPGYFELRVTLVWTDPPGTPMTYRALVNDLDLTVSGSSKSRTLNCSDQSEDILNEDICCRLLLRMKPGGWVMDGWFGMRAIQLIWKRTTRTMQNRFTFVKNSTTL